MGINKLLGEGYETRLPEERAYVGSLQRNNKNYFVNLDRPDPRFGRVIQIDRKHLNGAPEGMKVVVELLAVISDREVYGKISEVLGNPQEPNVAIEGIIRSYLLSQEFPTEVLAEVQDLESDPTPQVVEQEIAEGRLDLREQNTYTIDGLDAKDLDDAISVERLPEGYRLWVHIADVTHYLIAETNLDKEAFKRGNSVYLVDRVLPMLPPKLSNGLCSLNPHKDRLCLSCRLDFDKAGNVLDGELVETVIQSKVRSSYSELREIFAGKVDPELPQWFTESVATARELSSLLSSLREERGALIFDFPETKIDLDSEGKVLSITPDVQDEANQIIESFMIAANEYVAAFCDQRRLPAVYRVHEDPNEEKLLSVIQYVRNMGLRVPVTTELSPKDLQEILEQIKGENYAETLSEMLLRSLAKARYDVEDLGHFGLASEQYCHFTAPIRRYADVMVHRAVKNALAGNKHQKEKRGLQETAEHISQMERVAIEAERDTYDQKIVEYYADKLGEVYTGKISGFSNSNMYVRLPNTVEGAVMFASVQGGYIEYIPERMIAMNKDNGQIFRLGDEVKIQIAKVDHERRFLDFKLLEHESYGSYADAAADEKHRKRLQGLSKAARNHRRIKKRKEKGRNKRRRK